MAKAVNVKNASSGKAVVVKIEGGGGGGGGYDLVITGTTDENPHSWVASDLSVVSGSIEECERKCIAGEPVNAIVVLNYQGSFTFSLYATCGNFDVNYRALSFSFRNGGGGVTTGTIWSILYSSDYEFQEVVVTH